MRFRIFFAHVILYDRGSQTMGQEWRACQLLRFHVLPPTTGVGQGSTWCPRYSLPVWFPEVASIQFPIAGSAIQIYIYTFAKLLTEIFDYTLPIQQKSNVYNIRLVSSR